jgi:hypothetical protein
MQPRRDGGTMSDLDWLQANLPWTIPYSREFDAAKLLLPHLDMQHAMIHVAKSMGKLAAMFDHADHARQHSPEAIADVRNLVADLVVCALRMANVSPWGAFGLWEAVIERLGSRNGVDLAVMQRAAAAPSVADINAERDRIGLPHIGEKEAR